MNYYEYMFGEKQVMDKAPSRDAYVIFCNDADGTIPRLINAIGKHGNGGHTYDIVLEPDSSEKEAFCWDGDGSDRIDSIIKLNGKDADKDGKDALISMLLHTLESIKMQAEEPGDLEKPDIVRDLSGEEEKPMTREDMLKVFDDIIHDAQLCLSGCGFEDEKRHALDTIKGFCESTINAIKNGSDNKDLTREDDLKHIMHIAEEALNTKNKKKK